MSNNNNINVDVVIVGAGFAGMYQLVRMRRAGLSAVVLETADDVGGTWYWNRYPGARCDILTVDYSYSWDPELQKDWVWSERYATQPEILRYAQFVADKHDLRRDIRFSTKVTSAQWNNDAKRWRIHTDSGDDVTAQFYVMATGCLSIPKVPDIEGTDRFHGDVYFTNSWPHSGVDFSGKRVAVIGTGSSGIQAIPLIASQADQLTVFQRTPNFSVPAHNGPIADLRLAAYRQDPAAYREEARHSGIGVPTKPADVSALEVSSQERETTYEEVWQRGELAHLLEPYNDLRISADANDTIRCFIHNKIREIVKDPNVADLLCPTNHYFATKRPCLDSGYYATYNLPQVRLVDLQKQAIETITESGINTVNLAISAKEKTESMAFDAIVFATGFDAMTGAIVGVDITGCNGESLRDAWAHGPQTYLGLMTVGFPNLFMITGPGSPSVLSNMMVSIEQHVDLITDTIKHLRTNCIDTIEPTELAQTRWVQHSNEIADLTLLPTANSWYMGANVPGKPQVFLPYPGGVGEYRKICDEMVARSYLGFTLTGAGGTQSNDGVIRPLKPDVQELLSIMAELTLPPLETMGIEGARAFMEASEANMPPGPDVGEIIDGELPGADGTPLAYRLYRPATVGPHPMVAYYHGGGWVVGSATSDDPLCRYLCVESDSIIVSVNYRHAPEARFPAAADDGLAAASWITDHAKELGGRPGQLAVAGWSAGANIAAVTTQQAKLVGTPKITGQVLLNPVTDLSTVRQSYIDNAEGYILTAQLMSWFCDHYCDPTDRLDPRVSPLLADTLAGLPPALVITCEFDPLRDQGDAYAEAMAAVGVQVQHLQCPGQIHTAIPSVNAMVTSEYAREAMAEALRSFSRTPPEHH
ncbi:MAG: cation diffusion facilitator CzcD-associated flavoprotein CzcO/acetyl esterase/lipase [Zhongshania sp.]|jgi:cation diffusion facilitator CzcD-associated flavoprotein CzcO/acetyl esterase/lipase